MLRWIVNIVLAAALLSSCAFLQDDEVVARVGARKLHRSEVAGYIPVGTSPEDSAAIALQYINSWASDILFEKLAMNGLSKEEKDLSEELEDYRRSLLRYRFEQAYVGSRLDTEVTSEQVRNYYSGHRKVFTLERPILKVRFIDIISDSPDKEMLLKLMSSPDYEEYGQLDSLCQTMALRYFDSSDRWMDAVVLAREFGTDYGTMLSQMSGKWIRIASPGRVDERIAYIVDICRSGVAPLDFCEDQIRDILLTTRKRELIEGLERDLLDNAAASRHFVIY